MNPLTYWGVSNLWRAQLMGRGRADSGSVGVGCGGQRVVALRSVRGSAEPVGWDAVGCRAPIEGVKN